MGTVYLVPSLLAEDALDTIPPYVVQAIQRCSVFFVENERTTRRFFKQVWKEMVIDHYEWQVMNDEPATLTAFREAIRSGKTIGIVSEAGCPGVADPGQVFVGIAQEMNAKVQPLVGPSSILLALMASGMNGQQFQFNGYLPIDPAQRIKSIRELESASAKHQCTQLFIETPYRNNQLLDALLKHCQGKTKLCIAVDVTGKTEWIKTKTIEEWKKEEVALHKRPALFLLYAGH